MIDGIYDSGLKALAGIEGYAANLWRRQLLRNHQERGAGVIKLPK